MNAAETDIKGKLGDLSIGLLEPHILEAIEIIQDSVTETDKISISYSGGKDSTAVLFLVGLMVKLKLLKPEQVSVCHSDTTIEFPLLTKTTFKVLEAVSAMWGINVDVVSAPVEERFFATLLGIGRPVPNHAVRWCTDNLKLKPQQRLRKAYKDSFVLTGEHYGESSNRDKKLSSCGTSECGVADVAKIVTKEKLIRPIINWSDCKVWDFLFYADTINLLFPGVFSELSHVYEISNDDYKGGSLRTGCIGCPVINTTRHFGTESKGVPSKLSIKLRLILEELRDDNLRVLNPKIMGRKPNGHLGLGAIALKARRHYWEIIKQLNKQFSDVGIVLISEGEIEFIESSLDFGRYPKTYKPEQIEVLESEWLTRKPEWLEIESVKKEGKPGGKGTNAITYNTSESTNIIPTTTKLEYPHEFMVNAGECCTTYNGWTEIIKDKPVMTTTTTQAAKPFTKWAGGKSGLLKTIAPLLPKNFTKYCEPFVGGGALLFHLLNYHKLDEILINDSNKDLMVTYVVIQQSVRQLISELERLQTTYIRTCGIMRDGWSDRRRYFEQVRDEFNQQATDFDYNQYNDAWVTRAAQVIFLNKTCFNGLWRVRKRDGGFNTSFGDYDNPAICDRDNLLAVSDRLQGVYILCGDYQQVTEFVDNDTLVYLDPPYTPVSETANFVGYSKDGWGDTDNTRLLNWIKELSDVRQGNIVLSSSAVDCWDSLRFNKIEVKAKRAISCKVEGRDGVKELILSNY